MAGFYNRLSNRVRSTLRSFSSLGLDYYDDIIKNSRAVGTKESETMGQYIGDEELWSVAMSDYGQKKYIAWYDNSYVQKRDYLRKFSLNGEIDYILDQICDEAIVYDEKNFFAQPDLSNLDINDKLKEEIHETYSKMYGMLHFNDSITAWNYFRKFLIEGTLALEIIYDDKEQNIIAFKEIPPESLKPILQKDANNKYVKMWVQFDDDAQKRRVLYDHQLIYISYAGSNLGQQRISYLERLVRSFNLLRIMENSRVIWNVMNSTFRMKMVVPIGSMTNNKAKQKLAQLMAIYKEDIKLDSYSGDLFVNGKPGQQFYKNYIFSQKNGDTTELDSISYDGPDLSDTEPLNHFYKKLMIDSKLPRNRFIRDDAESFYQSKDDISREEKSWFRFLTRLRSNFQEILLKPLKQQIFIKHPELADDPLFNAYIGIEFNKDDLFEEEKEAWIEEKRVQRMENLNNIMDDDGNPMFPMGFLVNEMMKMDPNFMKRLAKWKKDNPPADTDGNDDW